MASALFSSGMSSAVHSITHQPKPTLLHSRKGLPQPPQALEFEIPGHRLKAKPRDGRLTVVQCQLTPLPSVSRLTKSSYTAAVILAASFIYASFQTQPGTNSKKW